MDRALISSAVDDRKSIRTAFIRTFLALCVLFWLVVTFGYLSEDARFASIVTGAIIIGFGLLNQLLGKPLQIGRLDLPSFFISVYLLILFVPAIFIFFDISGSIKYSYLVAMESLLLTFTIGAGLANVLLYMSSPGLKPNHTPHIVRTELDLKFESIWLILVVFSGVVLVMAIIALPFNPLIEAIKRDTSSIDQVRLRYVATELPKVLGFLYEIVRRAILMGCVVYAYLMSVIWGDRWKRIFPVLFVLLLIANSFSLERGPLIAQFAVILIAMLLVNNQTLFSILKPRRLVLAISAMLVGGVMTLLQYGLDFSFGQVLKRSWLVFSSRLFDPAYMASLAFQEFNADTYFLNGQYVRLLSVLRGREIVEAFARPQLDIGPVSFIGDLWRQWGWPGVIIGGVIIGLVFQLVDRQYLSIDGEKSLLLITIHAILLGGVLLILYGSVFGVMSVSVFIAAVAAGIYIRRSMKTGKIANTDHLNHVNS